MGAAIRNPLGEAPHEQRDPRRVNVPLLNEELCPTLERKCLSGAGPCDEECVRCIVALYEFALLRQWLWSARPRRTLGPE